MSVTSWGLGIDVVGAMMIGLFTIGPKLGGNGFDDGFPAWTKYLADDTRLRIGTCARRYGAYLVATVEMSSPAYGHRRVPPPRI